MGGRLISERFQVPLRREMGPVEAKPFMGPPGMPQYIEK